MSILESQNTVLVNTVQAKLHVFDEDEEHVWGGGGFLIYMYEFVSRREAKEIWVAGISVSKRDPETHLF